MPFLSLFRVFMLTVSKSQSVIKTSLFVTKWKKCRSEEFRNELWLILLMGKRYIIFWNELFSLGTQWRFLALHRCSGTSWRSCKEFNFNFYNWGKHNYYNLKIIRIFRFFRIMINHDNSFLLFFFLFFSKPPGSNDS